MHCPRCGYEEETSYRYCPKCWLEMNPTGGDEDPRIVLMRQAWEREHAERTAEYARWAQAPASEPPPGEHAPIAPPPPRERPRSAFEGMDGRLQAVLIVFAGYAAYELLVIASDLLEYRFGGRVLHGGVTLAEARSDDHRRQLVNIGELLFLIPAGVVWVRWFARAYRNVNAVGAGRRYDPGWAIGGWFVPIIALFRPKQIADDIWRATGSEPGLLLAGWWALWLGSQLIGRVLLRQHIHSADDLRTRDLVDIAASVFTVGAAVLACLVASRATAGLEARRPSTV